MDYDSTVITYFTNQQYELHPGIEPGSSAYKAVTSPFMLMEHFVRGPIQIWTEIFFIASEVLSQIKLQAHYNVFWLTGETLLKNSTVVGTRIELVS